MKRGIFILAIIIGFLLGGSSSAWCSWQYAESEAETTATSTAYLTKVQEVANSSGYHLILVSWETGISDTSAFTLSRVMRNSTVLGDYSLQTYGGSTRYRTFAFHSVLDLTVGDSVKIVFATSSSLAAARIKRARILLVPLAGMEYSTGTGLNVMNMGTSWSNLASVNVTPVTAGNYLVIATQDLRPNSDVVSGECRVELDGADSWDLMTMEGKSASDRVPYFSARVVNLTSAAHTLRLQARSDEGTATDAYNPRISVIRLTKKFNDFSQGEQSALDSTASGGDSWVNRLTHVHQPFQPGSYLALGSSFLRTIPDTLVIAENRWTVNGQEENEFVDAVKDSTDFLPQVGFKVLSWDVTPETLTVDYGKNSSGSEKAFIKDARVIALSEQLYTGFPVLDPIGPKGLVEGDTLVFKVHSVDPDADPITLSTLNLPDNAVFIDSGDGSGSFYFTPAFYQAGTYNITFIATDTTAKADTEMVTIPVSEFGNNDPVLDSIGAKSLSEGETLSVRIHATDVDLDSLILSALNLPAAHAVFVDSGNGSGSFIFTPDFTQSGIYNVTFKVADTLGGVDSEVVQITVDNVIRPPVLEAVGSQVVDEGGNLTFRIHATDPDGDSIILNALDVPTNANFVDSGNGSGSFVFDPDYTQAGIYHVTFIAADTFLAADTETVQITVNNINRDPVLDVIGPQSLTEGETLSVRIHATDLDLDSLILSALNLPSNSVFVDSGNGAGSLVFTPDFTQSNIYNVTFKVADTLGAVDSEVVQITVTEFGNHAPVLDSIGPQSLVEGDTLAFRIHAADLDLDSIILSALDLPANAVFVDSGNGAGSLVFTPSFAQSGIYDVVLKSADPLGGVDSEVVQITVTEFGNHAPVLDSIGAKSLSEGETLSVRIHATDLDLDSLILSVLNLPSNSVFVDSGNGAGSLVFTPDFTQSGIYHVTFKVADTLGAVDSEVVQITVTNVIRPPVLEAIGSQVVDEGGNLTFRIHATDPDGDLIILNALDVPTNANFVDSGNGAGSFVFDPDYTQSGIDSVTFIAADTFLAADTEIVQITVNNVNHDPVLDAIGPQLVDEGGNLTFRIHATDPDGDSIILNAVDVPTNAVFVDSGNGAGSFVFDPDYTQSGIDSVTFIAADTFLAADTEIVQITVNNVNHDPVLDAIGPQSLAEGETLSLRIHATDVDLDSLILSALNIPATNAVFVDSGNGAGSFVFTPDFTQSNIYNVTFKVADTLGAVDSEVVQITVGNTNRPPVLASIGSQAVDEAQTLQFRISGTDPDGDAVHFNAVNVPANATFVDSGNGAGSFTFSPNYDQAGPYSVTFIASDGSLADSEAVSITVNNVDRAPDLSSIGPRSVIEGGHMAFLVSATDPDGDSLVLSARNLPGHSSFTDSGNGKGSFKFDPDYTQSGIYNVTFKASDLALVDSEVVQITVIEAGNQAPVLDSIGPQNTAEGATLQFRVHASDSDGNIPALFVRNNPANSTFIDSGNGAGSFTFNPNYDQAGVYIVSFVTTDGVLQDSERVQITVAGTNRPPVLDSIGPKSVNEGDTLRFRVSASDPDGDSLVLSALNLPSHAGFVDSGNGAGFFEFVPGFNQSGIYNLTFKASDGALTDSEVVTITVNDVGNHAPVLSSIGSKSVDEGGSLSFRLSASDIDLDSLILSADSLPAHAVFVDSGNGAGSFVFDPDYTQSGSYNVTFIASDGNAADSEVVPITVNNVDRPPVLDSIGPQAVQESETLSVRIFASDPDGDSVALTAGNVPANAVFTDSGNGAGSFVFTPDFAQSGVYYVTFTASSIALTDSEVVQINVTEFGDHAPVLDSIGPKLVAEGGNLEFRIQATDADLDSIVLSALDVPSHAVFVDSGNGAGSFVFDPDYNQSGLYHVTFIASDGSLADSEVVDITVSEFGNHAPVLDSIGPKAVVEGGNLEFRIHAADIDSDAITLSALDVPNHTVFVDSGNGAGSFVFDPDFTQSGLYHVTFIASDGSLADSEVVDITVSEFGDNAPVLDSIGPKALVEGDHLEFGIHASDIDLDSIVLSALDVPSRAVFVDSGNGAGSFVFDPGYNQSGLYHVTFIASDGSLADSEVVDITVGEFGNHAPVLDSIGPKALAEGDHLEFGIQATDTDLDSITLSALDVPSHAVFVDSGNGAGSFVFDPDFTQSGLYQVTFIASDGFLADSETVEITVTETSNHAPVLDSIGPQSVMEGGSLAFRVHAVDADADPLFLQAYGAPRNAVFVDSGNGSGSFVIHPDYAESGVYSVTFVVNDPSGEADSEIVELSVIESGNHAPVLAPIGPQTVAEKGTLMVSLHASDLDLDPIHFNALDLPGHASLIDSGNGAGSFTFMPDSSQSGIYNVTFIASDTSLSDSEVVEITVTEWANHPPVLDSIGPKTVHEGDSLRFTVTASDSDGTIPVLTAGNLPEGATFTDNHNGHGLFRFKPTFYQAGIETVTFTAIDISNPPPLSDVEKVVITILDVNQAPAIDSIGPRTIQAGHTLNFRVVGSDPTDPDGGPLHLSAIDLPTHAVFHDSGGGVGGFTFTPDYSQVGVDTVTFFCTDEGTPPLSGMRKVEITVTSGANRPPVLDSIGYKMVTEGGILEFRVHASDPDGTTPLLYTSQPLPQNAVFVDSANGAGSFTFDPSYVQAGLYQITFYASDGQLSDYEQVMIQVVEAGNQAPILDSIGAQSLTEGDSLIIRIHASDPDSNAITLSLRNNPDNSSLVDSGNGAGVFRFEPSFIQAGIYDLIFKATDSFGKADSEVVQITVVEAGNQPPYLDSIGPKTVIERQWLNFTVYAHDPDEGTPILRAFDLPPSASFTDNHNGTGSFAYRPSYYDQGVYNSRFEAVDSVDTLLRDWEIVQITVTDSNQFPNVTLYPDSTYWRIHEGQTCQFRIIGTDPDGTIPIPHIRPLPTNATFVDSGNGVGLFTFTPGYNQGRVPQPITYAESSFVVDQTHPADTTWATPLPVLVYDIPEPPHLVSINDTSIVESQTLSIHVVTIYTVDVPTLQATGRPNNSSFVDSGNGRGVFRFSPDYTQGDSIYLVRFIAQNRGLADTEAVHITVIEWGQMPPVLSSLPDSINWAVGDTLRLHVHATDPDGPSIILSAVYLPNHSSFVDSGNGGGIFKFCPDSTQLDSVYHTLFIASDGTLADSEMVAMRVISFVRGDANADGNVELGDIVFIINYLFKNGPPPIPLLRADANCDLEVNLGDIVHIINYLYKGGPPPGCK